MDNLEQDVPGAAPTAGFAANVYTGLNREELDRICEALENENQIGSFRIRTLCYRRYANLRSNELHARLVQIYANLFTTYWAHFKHACPTDALPGGYTDRIQFVATNYISAWFWDLHVSIRNSVARISGTAFNQYFQNEVTHVAERYDPFLQHLNNVIKPTHIQNSLEDTLYIPLVSTAINLEAENMNIFGMNNFYLDENIVLAILNIMDAPRNDWNTVPLSTNTLGRPGWLFDYRLGKAYSWFPMESNFSRVDLIAPHILGIPCTPRLGPRDVDDWQFFPGGALPPRVNINNYRRVTERRFYGSAEYRTLETDLHEIDTDFMAQPAPAGAKRHQPEPSGAARGRPLTITGTAQPPQAPTETEDTHMETVRITAYRYRLIDWTCHLQVIPGTDQQTRNKALRNFIFQGARAPARANRD